MIAIIRSLDDWEKIWCSILDTDTVRFASLFLAVCAIINTVIIRIHMSRVSIIWILIFSLEASLVV